MKRNNCLYFKIKLAFFWLIFLMSVTCSYTLGKEGEAGRGTEREVALFDRPVGVDEFMINVDKYRGAVCVKGVVSDVFPNRQMFSLIDSKEYQSCRIVTCASLALPVIWTGQIPEIKDTVLIEGEVMEKETLFVFVARKLKKVELLKEGAP